MRLRSRLRGVGRRSVTSGRVLGSLGSAVAGQGILVVSGVLVARVLGVEGRGELALIILVPGILAQMGLLGLPFAVTHFIAREPANARVTVGRLAPVAFGLTALLVVLHAVVLLLVLPGKSDEVRLAAVLTLFAIPGLVGQQYGLAILQGQQRFAWMSTVRPAPAGMYALGVLAIFALGKESLVPVVLAWMSSVVLGAALLLGVAVQGLRGARSEAPGPPRREMLAFGLRGHLGSMSLLETMPVDQAIVGILCGPAALGLYVVGLAFTNLPRFVGQSIGMVAYPHISGIEDARLAKRAVLRFTALSTLACILVVGMIGLAASFLVPAFFGRDFNDSVGLLYLLLPGAFFYGIRRTLGAAISGMGRPGMNSVGEVVSWLVFLGVLVIVGPGDHGEGVAVAMSVAAGTSLAMVAFAAESRWRIVKPGKGLAKNLTQRPKRAVRAMRPRGEVAPFVLLACVAGGSAARLPPAFALVSATLVAGVLGSLALRRWLTNPRAARASLSGPLLAEGGPDRLGDDLRMSRFFFYGGLLVVGQLVIRPALATTLADWLFLVSLGLALLAPSTLRQPALGLPGGLAVGVGLFAVGALLSTAQALNPASSLLVTAKFVYLTMAWVWLAVRVLKTEAQVRRAMSFWTLSIAVAGAAAIAQYTLGDVIPGTSPHWGRMTGTGDHVNDLGGMSAVAIIPAISLIRRDAFVIVRIAVAGLILTGLLLSGAVAGMIAATLAGATWNMARGWSLRSSLAVVALGGLGLGVFQLSAAQYEASTPLERFQRVTGSPDDPGSTLWSRVETYRAAVERFTKNPLVGTGFDSESSRLQTRLGTHEAHNLFLGALYRGGMLAGIGMVVVVVTVVASSVRGLSRSSGTNQFLGIALTASFVAFLAFGMTAIIVYQRYGWVSAALLLAWSSHAAPVDEPAAARVDLGHQTVRARGSRDALEPERLGVLPA